jgi:sugar (pentulose or hexulose) kinase
VAVYERSGGLVADAYRAVGYASDELGRRLEFDPESLFETAMELVSDTLRRAPTDRSEQMLLAFTSQRHGCVFLDEGMEPVLAVANLDGRVDGQTLDRFRPDGPEIYTLTGRLPSEIFAAPRLAWLAEHDRERYRRIAGFLMINEWFSYRLTGVPRAEKTSITESLLFDINSESWSPRLQEIFGQRGLQEWEIVEPGEIVGPILEEVAQRFGLPANVLISLGAGDTQCAAIGSRAFEVGDVVAVNGSTTPVVMVTDELTFDPERSAWPDLYVGDTYLLESNGGKTGMVYRGVTEALSCQDLPEARPERIFDAERLGIDARLVPNPSEPIDFLGSERELRFRCDPAQLLQLLPYLMLENTAFAIAAHVEEVKRVTGSSAVRRVYLTGGSSRSLLTQLITSVLLQECPLHITSTFDTTSKGAAMLALSRLEGGGRLKDLFAAAGDGDKELEPQGVSREIVELVRERYHRWQKGYLRKSVGTEGL